MNIGPLSGMTVIELAGLGPAPFAGMLLAELGAEVIRIDRPGGSGILGGHEAVDILNRGKKSVLLDLKRPRAVNALLQLVATADVLIEGYRPGVAERLGVGPDDCFRQNPRLIYGRMTGWGQSGPLAQRAGHDIDYIAITGALHALGPHDGPPTIPLNLIGDFGGGATYLVMGILAALRETDRSGLGQVVDSAIVDGTTHLMSAVHMQMAAGIWDDRRGTNMLDGGAPYYSVYETADHEFMAVGAIEPKFYEELISVLDVQLDPALQDERTTWPSSRDQLARAFAQKTQSEWTERFSETDACVAPVLNTRNAMAHPHLMARETIVERDGVLQAAPAPRFSRTKTVLGTPPPLPGMHTTEILRRVGMAGVEQPHQDADKHHIEVAS
jgi:alpha-methylacyl-CoA racemase